MLEAATGLVVVVVVVVLDQSAQVPVLEAATGLVVVIVVVEDVQSDQVLATAALAPTERAATAAMVAVNFILILGGLEILD